MEVLSVLGNHLPIGISSVHLQAHECDRVEDDEQEWMSIMDRNLLAHNSVLAANQACHATPLEVSFEKRLVVY